MNTLERAEVRQQRRTFQHALKASGSQRVALGRRLEAALKENARLRRELHLLKTLKEVAVR